MAIFGMNGLYGAALYLATLFAVYGTKNAGFSSDRDYQSIQALVDRKGVAAQTKSGGRKSAIAELRRRRFQALRGSRYEALQAETGFAEAYEKKEWVR